MTEEAILKKKSKKKSNVLSTRLQQKIYVLLKKPSKEVRFGSSNKDNLKMYFCVAV